MTNAKNQDAIIGLWMELMRLWKQRMAIQLHSKRIHPLHLFAAHIIEAHPNLTMKEFAEHLKITSPSATALVNRLVRLKWVMRKTDPHNRKLVRLHINASGSKTLHAHMSEHAKSMRRMLSWLSAKDQKDFARVLLTLKNALEKEHS
jgi:DNA-binding MarR family transcriptional regulator